MKYFRGKDHFFELKNQLTIVGIYNYHGFFMFIAGLIKKVIIYFVIILNIVNLTVS